MGRKTLESMGRTLPKRVNWFITRDTFGLLKAQKVAYSIEEAFSASCCRCSSFQKNLTVFLSLVVVKFLNRPSTFADRLELTHVELVYRVMRITPPFQQHLKVASEQHIDDKLELLLDRNLSKNKAYSFAKSMMHNMIKIEFCRTLGFGLPTPV